VDTAAPDVRIHAFLTDRQLTLYLDTSGDALFKRGYRTAGGEAPLRENLAAGILRLAGWSPGTPLLDPMCGSGTFLTEAALIALDRAPGIGRRFAFEHLAGFDRGAWESLLAGARARAREPRALAIHGADRDVRALTAARENLRGLGLADAVTLERADVLELAPPAPGGILVTNPPYGVRLDEKEQLAAFYPRLGDALKQHFPGWTAYILSADMDLPKKIGLKASRRTPLYNGALECRLFEYRLVAGRLPPRRDP
jgi:putative N6-adenine-specific DNA methylase